MLILGIDTGGTYTDGVIINRKSRTVLHTAKALTTANNFSKGIEKCMRTLCFSQWNRIGMVGLSTTLATNAIVEGRGCRVGLILMGNCPEGKLPAEIVVQIDASVNIRGGVRQPLYTNRIDAALCQLKGQCDAVAVSGYASVRNPTHELEVKQRVMQILGLPVVCGHEMTGALGFYERTVTTVLNARLLPLIHDLVENVQKIMSKFEIHAPLMIVRGDGSMMYADYAKERPVETILSGPAASVIGARFLSDCQNGIVVDMGGTTTDIAALYKGECAVSQEGAVLSGWHTRVRALEIFTFGLGGDSEITFMADGTILVGPRKIVPLCRSEIVKGRTGLTPTDILHILGKYCEWPADRPLQAIRERANAMGIPMERLAENLYRAVIEQLIKSCKEGIQAFGEEKPIMIGVGAPAISWLTAAAAQLGIPCIVPRNAEVANAIGAAVGQVCETSQALIRMNKMDNSFYIYTEIQRLQACDLQAAQDIARRKVHWIAQDKAERAGAKEAVVTIQEKLLTDMNQDFIECKIIAKAVGYPCTMNED